MLTFPKYENAVYHESSDWDTVILFLKNRKYIIIPKK